MQLALDDFGTGYSSLAYLQEMDTDYLKIDKRFVDNIQVGSQELALCEAIIVMAHQLGLKVIAEGIETKLQMHCYYSKRDATTGKVTCFRNL